MVHLLVEDIACPVPSPYKVDSDGLFYFADYVCIDHSDLTKDYPDLSRFVL